MKENMETKGQGDTYLSEKHYDFKADYDLQELLSSLQVSVQTVMNSLSTMGTE